MRRMKFLAVAAYSLTITTSAFAQANLSAETASPGGATHLSLAHMTEIAGTAGVANIQLADGQTLTNQSRMLLKERQTLRELLTFCLF